MKNDFEKIKEAAEQSDIPYSEFIEGATKLLAMGISVEKVISIMNERGK